MISFVDILVHKYTEHLIWFSTCQTTIWSEHIANCILRKNSIDECIVILFLVLLIILSHDPKIFCINMYVLLYMHVSAISTIAFWLCQKLCNTPIQPTSHDESYYIYPICSVHCPSQPTQYFLGPQSCTPPPQLTIWLWLISNLLEYLIYSSSSWYMYPFCYYQLINYRKYKEGCYCDFTNIHVHT